MIRETDVRKQTNAGTDFQAKYSRPSTMQAMQADTIQARTESGNLSRPHRGMNVVTEMTSKES